MNPKLRALLQRKHVLQGKMEGISAAADREDRHLTAAEKREFDTAKDELARVDADISAEQRGIERERTAPAIGGRDLGGEHLHYIDEARVAPTGRRFAQMFPGVQLDSSGFRSMGEFLAAVGSGVADPRLIRAAASGGSEGSGVDGGFVVPTEFVAEMMDASLEDEIVRPRATVRPMASSSIWVGGFDTLNHSASIGGFDAQWKGEGNPFTFQKAKLRGIQLKASKLGILTAGTNELLADSSFYAQELPALIISALGFGLDEAFLRGNGVGQPLGVLNDKALIAVSKEVGQAADTITWENLKAMFARLHPRSQKNAVWVATHTAKVQLLSLIQFVETTAGSKTGTWIPVMRETDGRFYILGLEVIFTEKLPVLGDLGDILLADFTQYIIGMRKEVAIDKSGHVLFDSDETAFRGVLRGDGQGRWNAPVTPRNGSASNTTSWCVTLEAR